MTRAEITAFNSGVAAVLDLAAQSAAAMRTKLVQKPTRYSFAIEALDAVADEGRSLLLPLPSPVIPAAATA